MSTDNIVRKRIKPTPSNTPPTTTSNTTTTTTSTTTTSAAPSGYRNKRKREKDQQDEPETGEIDTPSSSSSSNEKSTAPIREDLATEGLRTPTSGITARRRSSPLTPLKISEKAELQELNQRLALYILKQRSRDASQGGIQKEFDDYKERAETDRLASQRLWEQQKNELCKIRDTLIQENAVLKNDVSRLENALNDLKAELEKHTKNAEDLERQINELQKELHSSKAQLVNSELRLKQLETELEIERKNYEVLKGDVEKQRKRADDAVAEQVAIENEYRKTKEDYQLLQMKNETEIQDYETKFNELSGTRSEIEEELRKEFLKQLEEILKDRQAQYEKEKTAGLDELKAAYYDKAKRYYDDNDKLTKDLEDERAKTAAMLKEIQSVKDSCHNAIVERESLNKKIIDQQSVIESWQKKYTQDVKDKNDYIQTIKDSFKTKEKLVDELLDVNVALTMEINHYRQLIENEEQRLGYVSPVKRRKIDETSGRVSITSVDLDRKSIVVKNSTIETVSIDGWKLRSREKKEEFKFSKITLPPAGLIIIWVGNEFSSKAPNELVWMNERNDPIFDSNGDVVQLVDAQGKVFSTVDIIKENQSSL